MNANEQSSTDICRSWSSAGMIRCDCALVAIHNESLLAWCALRQGSPQTRMGAARVPLASFTILAL